jgi:beta-alanine--pyruvate transaminase
MRCLRNRANVLDIRNCGPTAAIDLAPQQDLPGRRGYAAMESAFHDFDILIRLAGDTIVLTPPLILSEAQIDEIVEKTAKVIRAVA